MMRRLFLLFLGIMLLAAGPLMGQGQTSKVLFDDLVKDFGKSTEGEILTHVFRFTNQGQAVLEIIGLQPSCGCTSALLSDKRIQPGQSGQIKVNLNTRGLVGRLIKEVGVVTNDPERPRVRLRVQTVIQPEIAISERSVYFGVVPKGEEVRKEITLTIPPDKAIRILSAVSTNRNVTVELETVPDTDGKKLRLILTQVPIAKEGYHFGSIVIKTTSSLNPQLMIPVRGFIKAEGRN
jgi:hypothetical protein